MQKNEFVGKKIYKAKRPPPSTIQGSYIVDNI